MSGQISCKKFIFIHKDVRYESPDSRYDGCVSADVKTSFMQGAKFINQSKQKKNERQRRKSEMGFVSTIRRKLSSDTVMMARPSLEVGKVITEMDVDLLNVDIQQSGEIVTVTIINDIDMYWFRKSVKLFFQLLQLLQMK